MEKDSVFNKIPKLNYIENAPEILTNEFVKVVESRRSVRVYDSTPIPAEVVNKCLDLALLAPNSSNLQSWEFYWVRSPGKKRQVVEACLNQPAARTAQEIFVAVARTNTWKKNAQQMLDLIAKSSKTPPSTMISYYKKIVPLAYNMGPLGVFGLIKRVGVFLIGLNKVVPREPVSQNDLNIWAVKSTALACENLMLAFRAYGFDTCPMEGLDSKRIKKTLKLPKDALVVMAISAGKRAENGVYGPRIRFARDQFIKEV